MAYRPSDQSGIEADRESFLPLRMLVWLKKIGGQQRRYESSAKQGKQHLHRDGNSELLEELAGNRSHETRVHEHWDDHQADGDDSQADLVGRFERSLVRRFAHADMPHDVFDLDDRVID